MDKQPNPKTKRILILGILIITVALAVIAGVTAFNLYKLGQEGTAPTKRAQKTPAGQAPEVFQAEQAVCQASFTITVEASPSPSPEAPVCYEGECTTDDNGDDNCPGTLDCQEINGDNICVNSECPSDSDCACAGASPSPSPSPTASPSPSPSPQYECWSDCDYNYQCPGTLECLEVNGVNRCVNPSCRTRSDCECVAGTSPSPAAPGVSPSPGQRITYAPGVSPAPRQPQLPQAGSLSPTLIFTLGGLALVALGLLL